MRKNFGTAEESRGYARVYAMRRRIYHGCACVGAPDDVWQGDSAPSTEGSRA